MLEVNPLRRSGNDRAPRVAPGCCHKCGFVHQRQSMATEQRAVVICLIGKDHLDHGAACEESWLISLEPFRSRSDRQGKTAVERKRCHRPAFPSEACASLPGMGRLSGRSSDLQATYLLRLPGSWLNQCLSRSVCSCLPLRGSSGFSPDSLFSPISQSGTVKCFQYSL